MADIEENDPLLWEQLERTAGNSEASGKGVSAQQLFLTDWDKYLQELADMAPTTFKFFVASQSRGDYHDNFDSKTYFESMVSLSITYPLCCQEMKLLFEAGKLFPSTKMAFMIGRKIHPCAL